MTDLDLDSLEDELKAFAEPDKKSGRSAREERIIAGFEEIHKFVNEHDRQPLHGEGRDIFERLYAVRLDRLRQLRFSISEGASSPFSSAISASSSSSIWSSLASPSNACRSRGVRISRQSGRPENRSYDPDVVKRYRDACAVHDSGDTSRAIELFGELAAEGIGQAYTCLGSIYFKGQ